VSRSLAQEARALACYQEAWTLCEQEDEHFAQRGVTLNNLGRLIYTRGQEQLRQRHKAEAVELFQAALGRYEQALAAQQNSNQPEEATWTLLNIGDVYASLDQREQAHEAYQRALQQFRAWGERRGEGTVMNNFGLFLTYDPVAKDIALSFYLQALRIFRAVGDRCRSAAFSTSGPLADNLCAKTRTGPLRGLITGLACFYACSTIPGHPSRSNTDLVPGWLLASLRQVMGIQKTELLLQAAAERSWHLLADLSAYATQIYVRGGITHVRHLY